jgi:hypothetical protein
MANPVARKARKPAERSASVEANQAPPAPEAVTARSAAAASTAPSNPDTAPPFPAEVVGSAVTVAAGTDRNAPAPPMLDSSGAPRADAISAGWFYNRTITHLWSYDSPAGVWVWVEGSGWRRLSPASLFGHSQMTVLSTLATDRNLPVHYHEDASGQIDVIMV